MEYKDEDLFLIDEGQCALSAVSTILVSCHENTSSTSFSWTLTSQTMDLAILINLVVFQDGKLDLLSLVLDLLWSRVILLLALLGTTTKTKHQMKCRFLLDVVIAQCATIFQLLTSENQTLLIWRNALFVLNLSLDILDCVTWLHLEGDGLASQSFHEDLHGATAAEKKENKS